mmetsp:Transcript_6153/g.9899  ORF Transcript_6153/g.9899 Transcript_6153/m.9899 type:complete len:117 (-) Transcript_6153:17-367(-)
MKLAIGEGDKLTVNFGFRSNLKKISINAAQRKENRKESDKVHEKVLAERKHVLEAAIVKQMKARRTLKHTELLTEVLRLIRFPVELEVIAKRIDDLIEREYMRRDDKDNKVYHYVA